MRASPARGRAREPIQSALDVAAAYGLVQRRDLIEVLFAALVEPGYAPLEHGCGKLGGDPALGFDAERAHVLPNGFGGVQLPSRVAVRVPGEQVYALVAELDRGAGLLAERAQARGDDRTQIFFVQRLHHRHAPTRPPRVCVLRRRN